MTRRGGSRWRRRASCGVRGRRPGCSRCCGSGGGGRPVGARAPAQRVANLAGALEVAAGGGRLLAGGRAVLVDDLMTTGASLVGGGAGGACGRPGGVSRTVQRARRWSRSPAVFRNEPELRES